MKQPSILMFMFLVVCCNHVFFGQNTVYSTITKNINAKAASLSHDLNTAGDTLLLKSKYVLSKVEVISNFNVKVIPFPKESKEVAVPLSVLDVGNYTLSVFFIEGKDDTYIYSKTVVFKIARLLPIMEYANANTQLASTTDVITDDISIKASFNDDSFVDIPKVDESTNKIKDKKYRVAKHETMKQFLPPGYAIVNTEKFTQENVTISTSEISKKRVSKKESTIFVPYSLSDPRRISRDLRYVIQTRAEYRAANLRPNGKSYD